jgi:pimeloyl-ACP methyl ester carboxylesterase
MADGDYERGRGREIGAIAAKLKRLAAARASSRPSVFVLNGWAARSHAWGLCGFMRPQQVAALPRLFSYVEQLDGEPEKAIENVERCILVGWSMGGSSALRLAARWPEKIAGLVLIAATPRMMEEKESGWKGMSPRRLEALRYGVMMTHGEGFFGVPEGKPNPYCVDCDENLSRGLKYLLETDLRADLERVFQSGFFEQQPGQQAYNNKMCERGPQIGNQTCERQPQTGNKTCARRLSPSVHIFQSEHDGIVRAANSAYLQKIFPQASVTMVPGTEHALPVFIPELIDEAVDSCIRLAAASQDPA